MNIEIQRKIDYYLGICFCFVLSGVNFFGKFLFRPRAISETSNILIILLSEMGSLVFSRFLIEKLKKKYPHSNIFALVFAKNKEVLELLELIPSGNIFTINDSNFIKFTGDFVFTIKKIRNLKMDVSIDCELFARISSIISYLSGAARRVGFSPYTQEELYRGSFINRPVLYNTYHHIADQFEFFVEALAEQTTRPLTKI